MTARERFLALLYTGPLLRSDAIVVLAGEDAAARLDYALELMRGRGAPTLVLTGGLHEPPAKLGARHLEGLALGEGVVPGHIVVDVDATNTHEQAQNVVALAKARGWTRLLLVASPYHLPRAFLAFVRSLQNAGLDKTVCLLPAPASQAPWFQTPPGVPFDRLTLLARDADKVQQYQITGDVACWDEGEAYLRYWEARGHGLAVPA